MTFIDKSVESFAAAVCAVNDIATNNAKNLFYADRGGYLSIGPKIEVLSATSHAFAVGGSIVIPLKVHHTDTRIALEHMVERAIEIYSTKQVRYTNNTKYDAGAFMILDVTPYVQVLYTADDGVGVDKIQVTLAGVRCQSHLGKQATEAYLAEVNLHLHQYRPESTGKHLDAIAKGLQAISTELCPMRALKVLNRVNSGE